MELASALNVLPRLRRGRGFSPASSEDGGLCIMDVYTECKIGSTEIINYGGLKETNKEPAVTENAAKAATVQLLIKAAGRHRRAKAVFGLRYLKIWETPDGWFCTADGFAGRMKPK